ncbi:flagellar hook-associated protein FlgK [Oceaniglobus trochenteri]|uniref:flagellar hook-associated protein FlgK n=1 Tax=Oceaniglobus trochenteri TaxID=2763260 RepID=UPI001CFFB9F8|nr:flagellar hook-associated protein FlgK [Oceaniglobus trochenteri]
MSMSAALNNALSGLGAVGRSAQTVSSNIANALTPGYGRREVAQSAAASGGVQIDGISRSVNAAVLSDRRLADAEAARSAVGAGFLDRVQSLLGLPGDPGALSDQVAQLEGRLVEAASRPDSEVRLQSVVAAARDLSSRINDIGDGLQAERGAADKAIADDVRLLNTTLAEIRDLNAGIARHSGTGDANALKDQRQVLIDRISEVVPIRSIPRDRDAVALMTVGGQIILDGQAAEFGFTRANAVTPDMTLGAGQLSGLTLDGKPIEMNTHGGRMDGGRLAASFALRDQLAPEAQGYLDNLARDLIERFESSGLDPTRGPGDPGLFTENGAALSATPAVGLAQRLRLNALVDPDQGGSATRLRDGLGAMVPGPVGESGLLQSLADALGETRPTVLGLSTSAAGLASELVARTGGALFQAEQSQVFAQSRADALREQELTSGVDSDQEMQKLLMIEQSYGANARVIQVIDSMMRRLLEI